MKNCFLLMVAFIVLICTSTIAQHRPAKTNSSSIPSSALNYKMTTVSNHEFYISNYGVYGKHPQTGIGAYIWPRGSGRSYIYAAGFQFLARKRFDTIPDKIVESLGYNPPGSNGWFSPGSIDDGLTMLPDSDSRSKKYIVYRSTEYNAQGAHFSDSTVPDWPIRWVDQTKTPGENGYFGMYVADTNDRKNYAPVYISQEDIFCIYKDTDTTRIPIHTPSRGTPFRIEIEQTMYTWSNGPQKDLVFVRYLIKNKSIDTLHHCYFGPVIDPDIGNSSNDFASFYHKDSILNFGYQYTGTETGYNGIVGIDLIETPRITSVYDSIQFFLATEQRRKVGEQIGVMTFRVLDWSWYNPVLDGLFYSLASSHVKNSLIGNDDIHLAVYSGPFRMLPADSISFVVGLLIAPSVGSVSPDVENSLFLDSLIELDKFAQKFYDDNMITSVPSEKDHIHPQMYVLKQNYPNPFNSSTTITFTLPKKEHVILKIYDILGREIDNLLHTTLPVGTHTIHWNAKHINSGVYFYQLTREGYTQTKKMLLIQ